jgi:hypothetical protein
VRGQRRLDGAGGMGISRAYHIRISKNPACRKRSHNHNRVERVFVHLCAT